LKESMSPLEVIGEDVAAEDTVDVVGVVLGVVV
jgi:hypothetical protein